MHGVVPHVALTPASFTLTHIYTGPPDPLHPTADITITVKVADDDAAMGERGILFIYGGLSGQPTPYPHWHAAYKGLSLRGWIASEIWNHPHRFDKAKDLILRGLAGGQLKPVIAKTFPLDRIADAHTYLEANQQVGKVVVTV